GGQTLERVVHLLRGTFENPSAAPGKQGVATEQPGFLRVIAEEGNMIQGVTGHCDDANALAGQVDLITVGECPVDTVDGRVVRPENPALGGGLERQYPAGMVPVVMGQQNCAQLVFGVATEPAYHRSGVTRVDSGHLEGGVICQQPD